MTTYRVAIIGAGPAGYFTAQALNNLIDSDRKIMIDMFDRLPTPWGLVRSGVAPDHPKIRTVTKVFEKIAVESNYRYFGNIEVGSDISLEELKDKYDAVILATGSSVGKKLGLPGEEFSNSISAADFVPWYNGHPDYASLNLDLSNDTAIVIGAGNVAMDCARMLAVDPTELEVTDTAEHAIVSPKNSKIRKVYICARRGAEFAAFTSPELRELPDLEHTNVIISKSEIIGDKDLAFNLEQKLNFKKDDKDFNAYIFKAQIYDTAESSLVDSRGISTEEIIKLTVSYQFQDKNGVIIYQDAITKDKRVSVTDNLSNNVLVKNNEKKLLLESIIQNILFKSKVSLN